MIDPIELHAWADGELAQDREAVVRRLLAESPTAQAEFESILALKRALRDRMPAVEFAAAWTICKGRINELDRTRRVERLASGRFAWGLSGVFLAAIVVAGLLHRGHVSSNINSAELSRMLVPFHGHQATTSPDERAKLDDLLKKAQISVDPHRMDILGREYGDWDGRTITRYLLRDASGFLNLMIVPDQLQIDGAGEIPRNHSFLPVRAEGLNGVAWNEGRGTLILLGNRSFEDLATVASGFH